MLNKFSKIFFCLVSLLFILSLLYNGLILGISSLIEAIDILKSNGINSEFLNIILTFLLSIILLVCAIGLFYNIILKQSLRIKIFEVNMFFVILSVFAVIVLNILDVGYFNLLKYFTVSIFTFGFTFGVSVIPFLCSLTYLNILLIVFLLLGLIRGWFETKVKQRTAN